jgi:hypothetical protein
MPCHVLARFFEEMHMIYNVLSDIPAVCSQFTMESNWLGREQACSRRSEGAG